jgi:SCP-2 sterol transfer family
VARYLSPAWVESFDAALGALDLADAIAAAATGSLLAADGAFTVAQVVEGAPDPTDVGTGTGTGTDTHTDTDAGTGTGTAGTVRTVLTIAEGRAHLVLDPDGAASDAADVTLLLGYADALALARGELEPADALAAGRIRVRGDLAALVAAQSVLQAASAQLGSALVGLTDPADPPDPPDGAS